MSEFTIETVSIAGAPDINFEVRGGTMRAELAGAKLYAEACGEEEADLRITGADGFVLADIRVNRREGVNLTENVRDIGAALLWSHWRFVEAQGGGAQTITDPSTPNAARYQYSKLCPLCDAGPGADCVVWPQFGKLYSGCELRMSTKKSMKELIAKSSIGEGLADIKARGIDAHLADIEKGKF